MTKILFLGDTHGDITRIKQIIDIAVEQKCDEIVQLGDFGYLWPRYSFTRSVMEIPMDDVNTLSAKLTASGIPLRFIDGNHDLHPELRKLSNVSDNLAPFITYQSRGSIVSYKDGLTIVFLGGAPSIDRRSRTEGVDWWPEEYITDIDISNTLQHVGKDIDILVTHDAPKLPPGIREIEDQGFNMRAWQSQEKIQTVIRELKPKLNAHGHYHKRYDGRYLDTKIIGLASNLNNIDHMYYIYQK